jgi:cardiolipin synthase
MGPENNHSPEANSWQKEILYQDGDSFFHDLFEAIHSAKHSIKIETYIFERDSLGIRLLKALGDAANRGVKVKLLLDGAGCSEWNHEDTDPYRKRHFEIRFFHPLIWQRRQFRLWKYLSFKRIIRGFGLMNHRNHRKVYLIDEEIAFLGSMNVSENHLHQSKGTHAWRDTSVQIQGNSIKVLHESFDEAWNYFHNYHLRYFRKSPIREWSPLLHLNRFSRERRSSNRDLMQRFANARHRICITNPYFIPTWRLQRILKAAIENEVKVVALFPSKSDVWQAKFAMEAFYAGLLKSGVEIHEYQPSMIHAKTLITDDQALIGTTNLNTRSFFLDLEVDVEITHPDNIDLLKKQFEADLSCSKKIELKDWKQRPFQQKILENVFLLFRWML